MRALVGAAVFGGALLVTLGLTAPHLARASPALLVSTLAGCVAVAALAAQPWLTRRRVPAHVRLGGVVAVLVAVHVLALVVESPDDALYSMSPDGPTRARMALFATVLLAVVTLLGLLRRRLRWSAPTWRFVHGSLAGLVVVLGVGHAVLIQGALDGWGTPVLLALGGLGVVGVVVRLVMVLRTGDAMPHDRGRVRPAGERPG
ncbi:ferric reductase-like transmembrane domain-containing protein [Actinomycetospora aeridis]|uniref:Ferric reductase-like transmembrane domain-containing protein n=1 Tax=Actinomycetospora aeridis TaxID=3129231 RepID=A0ABU8N6U7_9PSEU